MKITVEGIGVFFQISDKGWKEKRKERERRKKRAVEHQLTTSRSSSQGSFLLGYQRTTCTHFNFSREYPLLTYSLDLSRTKIGSKRLIAIYLLWGEGISCGVRERRLNNTDSYNGHKQCCNHEDCRAKGCLAKTSFIDQVFKGLLRVKSPQCTTYI